MKYVSPKDSRAFFETGKIKGKGSFSSPFIGDLRRILETQPPCETLQLLEAPAEQPFFLRPQWDQIDFENRPSECLSPALRLRGAGRTRTWIQFADTPGNTAASFRSGHDVEISDLTVDCAASGNEIWSRNGIVLSGNDCVVERVGVRRMSGCRNTGNGINGSEGFAIVVGEPHNQGGVITSLGQRNNRVEQCVVEDARGTYVNGISCASHHSVVRRNTVIMPCASSASNWLGMAACHMACFNVGLNQRLLFEDNVGIGGTKGCYAEQFLDGARFYRNTFLECGYGGYSFSLREPMRDCEFVGERIIVNGNTGGGVAYGFVSTRTAEVSPIENVRITEATLRRGLGDGLDLFYPLVIEPEEHARNIRFENNCCHPWARFKGLAHVRSAGNCFTDGAPCDPNLLLA